MASDISNKSATVKSRINPTFGLDESEISV